MISGVDILQLPCPPDLIEGGIAYALHSLPSAYHRMDESIYEHLRRTVAGAAVELAFRHHLSARGLPFDVKGAMPFSAPDRYDVTLGGRRCEVKSFLITDPAQVANIEQDPRVLLRAPALVPSDPHAGCENSPHDLYLFAFLPAAIATSGGEVRRIIAAGQPYCLVHVMPESWRRPSTWSPLGRLVLKSDSDTTQIVEIGGLDEARELRSCRVELPPRARVELDEGFFSVPYIRSFAPLRTGIYSPVRRETLLIDETGWRNIWVYSTNILLAGYLTREEFSRRAHFVPAGSRVFQYRRTQVKNLAVPVSELRPLSELFERVKIRAAG